MDFEEVAGSVQKSPALIGQNEEPMIDSQAHSNSDLRITDARRQWREEQEYPKQGERWLQVKTMTTDEFLVIKILSRSFYGPVKLVKDKATGNLYSMKSVHKTRGLEDEQMIRYLNNERTLLIEVSSVWVVRMFHSFQDSHFYFLLLEYIPGGSLAELLHQEGTLLEYQARFYGAEMLMAINVLHRYGFMHRNIHPSNFLLDNFGHVKIVDFGYSRRFLPMETCQKLSTDASIQDGKPFISGERRDRVQIYQRKSADSHAGPVDFMAPEVARPHPKGIIAQIRPAPPGTEYTFACDFWSFGVCMYYFMFGQMPFLGKTNEEVRDKIIRWRQNLFFPTVQPISDEAKDLIKSLLCDEPYRLGLYGCEDVMSHVFFEDTDWMHLRNLRVPVPYKEDREDSSSSVGTPDYILELLKEGNCASHNDGGNHTGSNTMPSAETYNVDNLAGNSGNEPQTPASAGRSLTAGLRDSRPGPSKLQTDQLGSPALPIIGFDGPCVTGSGPDEKNHGNPSADFDSLSQCAQDLDATGLMQDLSGDGDMRIPFDPETVTEWLKRVASYDHTDGDPHMDLDQMAADNPEAFKEAVLTNMTAKELRRLSEQKAQMEGKVGECDSAEKAAKKEKKRLACQLM